MTGRRARGTRARDPRPRRRAAGRSRSSTTTAIAERAAGGAPDRGRRRLVASPCRPSFGVFRVPRRPGLRLRAGQPERARRSSASRRSGRSPRRVDATGPVRHRRRVPPARAVRAARAAEAVDDRARGALWLQLGVVNWEAAAIAHEGGLAGRHGPLHGDRAPPARAMDGDGQRPRAPRLDQLIANPRTRARTRDRDARRRSAPGAGGSPSPPTRRSVDGVPHAAAPGLVAGDVGVLLLERLVARHGAARTRCSRPRSARRRATHRTMLIEAHASAAAPSSALADGLLDQRRVRLAARRLHHLADEEADRLRLAGAVVRDRLRVRRDAPSSMAAPSAPASEIWRKPFALDDRADGLAGRGVAREHLACVRAATASPPRPRRRGRPSSAGIDREPRPPRSVFSERRGTRRSPSSRPPSASTSRRRAASTPRTARSRRGSPTMHRRRRRPTARTPSRSAPGGPPAAPAARRGSRRARPASTRSGGRSGSGK